MSYKKAGILLSLIVSAGLIIVFLNRPGVNLAFHPGVGTRLDYALDYQSSSESILREKNSVIQDFPEHTSLSAKGRLLLTVLGREGDQFRLAGELQLDTSHGMPDQGLRQLNFAFLMNARGQIQDLHFPEAQFANSSFLVVDVLKRIDQDFPVDPLRRNDRWSQNEPQMEETIRQENRLISFTKDQAHFHKTFAAEGMTLSGTGRYVWDTAVGVLRQVELDRVTEQKNLQGLDIRTELKLKLVLQGTEKVSAQKLVAEVQTYEVKENLKQDQLRERMQERNDRKRMEGMTAEQIRAAFAEASPTDLRSNMDIYLKLKALFRLHPESVALFKDQLWELDRNDQRFRMLAMALTAVGHHEAQQAIIEAIHRSDDDTRRMQLIPHLSFTGSPEPASEEFLQQLAASDPSAMIQKTAELGLGTMAHQLREQQPDRSQRILEAYAQGLQQSPDADGIRHHLAVIGNIGLSSQTDLIKPYLQHSDPKVRSSAYASLRFVDDPDAKNNLIHAVRQDPDDFVREHAAEGLTYGDHASDVILKIQEQLASEKNIAVIKHLIRVLATDAVRNPSSREFIAQYNENCAHPDLCGFVAGVLSSLPAKGG